MNKKHLIAVSFLIVIVIVAIVGGIYFGIWKESADLQGKLVFSRTFDAGARVDRITIETAEDIVELRQKNSYWFVVNKGNYYADFHFMHQLLTSINQSIYSIRFPYDAKNAKIRYLLEPEESRMDSGMLITTYAGEELLDKIIVGLADDDNRYYFARRPDKREIWLINGNFDLPVFSYDWLLRPVLSVPRNAVESVTIGDKYVQRKNKSGNFYDEKNLNINIEPLLDVLSGVYIIDALKKEAFEAKWKQREPAKVIDVITFYGLEFILRLYYDGGQVWLNVDLSTTPLPISSVKDYIKDNRFLYDGWFFEVHPEQSRILRDFRLM